MKRIWDISPPVAPGAPVFPGDTPYQQHWAAHDRARLPGQRQQITLSPHVGAHADAPLHYDAQGASIGRRPRALPRSLPRDPCDRLRPLVQWEHLAHAARELPPRVLVRTYERMPVDRWDGSSPRSRPRPSKSLLRLGVQLVGIDTASIDPADSKTLDSHQVIRRLGLRVLENLVLDDVPEGDYELIALPLKLMTADASPVRAVLRQLMTSLHDCRALDAQDPLRTLRELFTLPEGVIYLDGNSLGVLPKATPERVAQAINEEWGQGLIRSGTARAGSTAAAAGDKMARLVGARPGEVVVTDSTSINLYKVLSAALASRTRRLAHRKARGERAQQLPDRPVHRAVAVQGARLSAATWWTMSASKPPWAPKVRC